MESTGTIDNIIIGGGIAGLYIAHQLSIKNEPYLLFDDFNTESRVKTINTEYGDFDVGAGIVCSSQKNIMYLLKYYKLDHKLFSSTGDILYHMDKLDNSHVLNKNRLDILNELRINANMTDTIHELLLKVVPDKTDRELFMFMTSDYFESKDRLSKPYFDEIQIVSQHEIYLLKDGLGQLTKAILNNVKENVKNHKVLSIKKDDLIELTVIDSSQSELSADLRLDDTSQSKLLGDGINKTYKTKKLFMCLGKNAIQEINFINLDIRPLLNSVKTVSSCKELILFKHDVSFMNNYSQIVTNLFVHWILKINDKTIMVYSDGEYADFLHTFSDEKRLELYIKDINTIFNLNLTKNDTLAHYTNYWPEAFCNPTKEFYTNHKAINTYLKDNSIIQTLTPQISNSDIYTAWMESHLLNLY